VVAAAIVLGPLPLGAADSGVAAGQHPDCHAVSEAPPSEERGYTRSETQYRVPETTLIDQDGREVDLPALLLSPKPVALNFIFTSCPTICPVMTATFAHMRKTLDGEAADLRMVSISIDPEYDTPKVLKAYADRHRTPPDWRFLTGTAEQILAVQKAFDAYTGNKMNHRPLTFFKPPGATHWVRIEGLAGGNDLATEYRQLVAR